MPLISGPSYKIFITLFTGLAVGSLLGSAIFSLIPQAFSLHLSKDKEYLWKSLVIFLGIYLFYCSERLMRIYFERKTKQNLKHTQQKHIQLSNKSPKPSDENEPTNSQQQPTEAGDRQESDDNDNLTAVRSEEDNFRDHADHHHHHHHHALNPQEILTKALKKEAEPAGQAATSDGKPFKRKEIAPVAWMIIIGDGLHNFIDGLSIGAAFSDSISLGCTTSLAVIFEEFPHELGDFAVLISSGMTVRQALTFNFLSACTCYIGMIFGILLGDLTASASYIFALAGGMFLYISLVDMMGELSAMLEEAKHSLREVSRLLLMQNIGILTGIITIFTLSLLSSV